MINFLLIILTSIGLISHLNSEEHVWNSHKECTVWFSNDWQKLYFFITLDPEEDSPFHYGIWGIDRGTHLFEISFFNTKRDFIHSTECPCCIAPSINFWNYTNGYAEAK